MTERGIAPDLDPLSRGWLFDPYPLLRRARLEEPVLLLGRLPNLRLDPARPPERDPIFFARGYTRLFVTWDVAWAASGDSA